MIRIETASPFCNSDIGESADAACNAEAMWKAQLPTMGEASVHASATGAAQPLICSTHAMQPRMSLCSAGDLLARPPLSWLVQGVLPQVGIGVIYGASTAGKSFLALDLLAHLASGSADWFGHRITKSVATVYVSLEGEGGLSGRVRAWQERRHLLPGAFRALVGHPFSLLSEQHVSELAEAVLTVAGSGSVICIDTLNAAAPGADENSCEAMGRIVSSAKRLQSECGALVLLVHHAGKDSSKGMRGHSSLFAACDFVLEVGRKKDLRHWTIVKSKDGVDGESHQFRLDLVDLGTDPEQVEPITSCVVAPEEHAAIDMSRVKLPSGDNQKTIFDALGELLSDSKRFGMAGAPPTQPCVRLEEAINKTRDRLACDPKRRNERTRGVFARLVSRGAVMEKDGWLWLP